MSSRTAELAATVGLALAFVLAAVRAGEPTGGLPDGIRWPRFPFDPESRAGVDNPQALSAAIQTGFIAFFGRRHVEDAGHEWPITAAGGGEILEIEDSYLQSVFAPSEKLEKALESGALPPDQVEGSEEFKAAVQKGIRYADRIAAAGGILNLFNHYWETFAVFGGIQPRYLVLDAVLDAIDRRYSGLVWYPGARELALWLDARRRATVWKELKTSEMILTVEPPPRWRELKLTGIPTASLVVEVPEGWNGVRSVRIREEGARWESLDPQRWWTAPGGLALSFPLRGSVELRIRRGRA